MMQQNTQKPEKITETLANRYSSESIQWELSNEYQHDRNYTVFKKKLHHFSLAKSSLSIERVELFIGISSSLQQYQIQIALKLIVFSYSIKSAASLKWY